MYQLYHYPICPISRQVRIMLCELNLSFTLIKENYWQRNSAFLKINPAGILPVLANADNLIIGIYSIIEYLNEKYPNSNLANHDLNTRCEIRRLLDWLNNKFYREVSKILIDEKVIKRYISSDHIMIDYIKIAKANFSKHLNYFITLLEKRSFIAAETLTYADIAASAHLSVLDYFGEINWDLFPIAKEWYSLIKSRPSFRSILQDKIAGFAPSASYINLDF